MYVIGAICVALRNHGSVALGLLVLMLGPFVLMWLVWMMVMGRAMIGAPTASAKSVVGFMVLNSVVVVVVVFADKVVLSW